MIHQTIVKHLYLLLFIGLFSHLSEAQQGIPPMERFRFAADGWQGFVLKPEIEFIGGISIPRGKFAKLGESPTTNGAAAIGYFGELNFIQRSNVHPLWSMRLSLGYMHHPFQKTEVFDSFQLDAFTADDWSIGYLMPGFCFRGGKRLRFELQIAAGVLIYNGWNARRGLLNKIQDLQVYTWKFKNSLGGALRFGGQLGFDITKRFNIFAQTSIWFGSGKREGIQRNERFKVDPVTHTAIEPPLSSTEDVLRHEAIFSMIHLGLGFRYKLFKYLYNPNIRYWNYY